MRLSGGEDDAFASVPDSGPPKQGPQVLFHSARADAEFGGDFFVAAACNQQLQDVLIAASDFDFATQKGKALRT